MTARTGAIAIVMGGFVNGYSIVQELSEMGVKPIWVIDSRRSLATYSRLISGFTIVPDSPDELLRTLTGISEKFGRIVPFPTSDLHLENLWEIRHDIASFCFLPFNPNNLPQMLDKYTQYEQCSAADVPYPTSVRVREEQDFNRLVHLRLPIIIKPAKRYDLATRTFRSRVITDYVDVPAVRREAQATLANGYGYLASEVIPGKDDCIYAYTAYRSSEGHILNEWVGRKLSQHPEGFGVFSTATNDAPDEVRELGRRLIDHMNLFGIVEPEFKYDARDGTFKLMEVNLRSHMWHRVGSLSGVKLHYTQWLNANNESAKSYSQDHSGQFLYVYLPHEIANLIQRPTYWHDFRKNVISRSRRVLAVYNRKDLLPAMVDGMHFVANSFRFLVRRVLGFR